MKIKKEKSHLYIILFFIVFICLFTHKHVNNANSASRFITMESIVERKTFTINEKYTYTNDKIKINNDYYSSKPPVLSVIGAGVYYVLHNFINLNFGNPVDFYLTNNNITVYIITLLLVGSTFILLLYYLYKSFELFKIKKKYQNILLLGFGLGTLYLPFSITLNNHTIAGSLLFVSFYYLLKIKQNKKENLKRYIIIISLLTSLSATIDLPTGLTFLILFYIYLNSELKKYKWKKYYILNSAPFLILHLCLNYIIIGDILPAQLHPEYWEDFDKMLEANNGNIFLYIFNIYFGSRGLLLYSPILLFSFYSMFKIIRDKNNILRKEVVLILSGFIIISLFYILKFRGYTGSTYGFRWFIAITPLIYFFTMYIFKESIYKNNKKIIFQIIMLLSILISIIGLNDPWVYPTIINNKEIIGFPLINQIINIYYKYF